MSTRLLVGLFVSYFDIKNDDWLLLLLVMVKSVYEIRGVESWANRQRCVISYSEEGV